jgi:hypothetical protein
LHGRSHTAAVLEPRRQRAGDEPLGDAVDESPVTATPDVATIPTVPWTNLLRSMVTAE